MGKVKGGKVGKTKQVEDVGGEMEEELIEKRKDAKLKEKVEELKKKAKIENTEPDDGFDEHEHD